MNKTVLITGAAKGIGAALAKEFSKKEYNIVINYLTSKKEALDLKKLIEQASKSKVLIIKADITNEEEVNKMFDKAIKVFGNIDILINNAAYVQDNYYQDKTKNEFMRVLEVNVFGSFLMSKIFANYNQSGKILNISSTDAEDTYNDLSIDYCASKAGLNNLTKTLSLAMPTMWVGAVMLPWVKTEEVMKMDPNFLKQELKRINQSFLLEPASVAKRIIDILECEKILSGSILRMEVE